MLMFALFKQHHFVSKLNPYYAREVSPCHQENAIKMSSNWKRPDWL